jgi:transposase
MVRVIKTRGDLEQHLVFMHSRQGWSIRALAKYFAVSRNTVRQILRKHQTQRDHGQDAVLCDKPIQRGSKLDTYEEPIKRLLEKYPKITGQRLYEELVAAGYNGGISILRDHLRRIRPRPKREPVIRFETEPGLQGQMDWSPYTKSLQPGR